MSGGLGRRSLYTGICALLRWRSWLRFSRFPDIRSHVRKELARDLVQAATVQCFGINSGQHLIALATDQSLRRGVIGCRRQISRSKIAIQPGRQSWHLARAGLCGRDFPCRSSHTMRPGIFSTVLFGRTSWARNRRVAQGFHRYHRQPWPTLQKRDNLFGKGAAVNCIHPSPSPLKSTVPRCKCLTVSKDLVNRVAGTIL